LLLSHHLKEDYHSTAYSINVYLISGPQAIRLTRLSREAIEGGAGQRIECTFLRKTKTSRNAAGHTKRKNSGIQTKLSTYLDKSESPERLSPFPKRNSKKRKRTQSFNESDDDFIVEDDDFSHALPADGPQGHSDSLRSEPRRRSPSIITNLDEEDDDTWTFTMDEARPPAKRRRTAVVNSGPGSDDEVYVLSD
jgi:ATP-dependent DNA helicase Q1